jgi:hypothetical protein
MHLFLYRRPAIDFSCSALSNFLHSHDRDENICCSINQALPETMARF